MRERAIKERGGGKNGERERVRDKGEIGEGDGRETKRERKKTKKIR